MGEEHPVILLVEDSDSDALLIEQAFRKARVLNRLLRVPNAREAMMYLEGKAGFGDRDQFPMPLFVLMDLMLPDVTGYELLRWIRSRTEWSMLPIVVVTGSEYPEEENATNFLGANAFFRKNLRLENLIQMVRSVGASWALRTNS